MYCCDTYMSNQTREKFFKTLHASHVSLLQRSFIAVKFTDIGVIFLDRAIAQVPARRVKVLPRRPVCSVHDRFQVVKYPHRTHTFCTVCGRDELFSLFAEAIQIVNKRLVFRPKKQQDKCTRRWEALLDESQ